LNAWLLFADALCSIPLAVERGQTGSYYSSLRWELCVVRITILRGVEGRRRLSGLSSERNFSPAVEWTASARTLLDMVNDF
jgi:hypothetical protein